MKKRGMGTAYDQTEILE